MLKSYKTEIPEVLLLEPISYEDDRGFFYESFNQIKFNLETGLDVKFVQDNHSKSKKNVIRGLHFQKSPHEQGKLVRVVRGEIFDVAVDIRPDSPTFGEWVGEILSSKNRRQLWIPGGFAHGFLSLTEGTEVLYKTTNMYSKYSEGSIVWNDPQLNIKWPLNGDPILSDKDANAPYFKKLIEEYCNEK